MCRRINVAVISFNYLENLSALITSPYLLSISIFFRFQSLGVQIGTLRENYET